MQIENLKTGKNKQNVVIDGEEYILNYHLYPSSFKGAYKDKDWLHQMYVTEDMTMEEIANMCHVTPMTINIWLNKYSIATRSRGGRKKVDTDE